MMESGVILAILSMFLTVALFVYQRFIAGAEKERQNEHRFTVLEGRVDLYWKSVEDSLAKVVHSPHLPEVDGLLDKIVDGTITLNERIELRTLLINRMCNNSITPEKCFAAQALIVLQDGLISHQLTLNRQKRIDDTPKDLPN